MIKFLKFEVWVDVGNYGSGYWGLIKITGKKKKKERKDYRILVLLSYFEKTWVLCVSLCFKISMVDRIVFWNMFRWWVVL